MYCNIVLYCIELYRVVLQFMYILILHRTTCDLDLATSGTANPRAANLGFSKQKRGAQNRPKCIMILKIGAFGNSHVELDLNLIHDWCWHILHCYHPVRSKAGSNDSATATLKLRLGSNSLAGIDRARLN